MPIDFVFVRNSETRVSFRIISDAQSHVAKPNVCSVETGGGVSVAVSCDNYVILDLLPPTLDYTSITIIITIITRYL